MEGCFALDETREVVGRGGVIDEGGCLEGFVWGGRRCWSCHRREELRHAWGRGVVPKSIIVFLSSFPLVLLFVLSKQYYCPSVLSSLSLISHHLRASIAIVEIMPKSNHPTRTRIISADPSRIAPPPRCDRLDALGASRAAQHLDARLRCFGRGPALLFVGAVG